MGLRFGLCTPEDGTRPPHPDTEKHMGLTIHYRFHADTASAHEARRLVEQLREKALDLPFKEVGELVDLGGDGADPDTLDRDDPNRRMLIQAGQ